MKEIAGGGTRERGEKEVRLKRNMMIADAEQKM